MIMKENFRPTVLRNKAWNALSGKWGASAVAFLVLLLITGAASIVPLGALFVGIILMIGGIFLWWDVANGKVVEIKTLFEGFNDYLRYLIGGLLFYVYILLWTLLFVIPGIIKSISYSQTFYLMRDDPQLKGEDAIKLSMKMMDGHKMDYFLLQLSFIGWLILSSLTFGILLLWVGPYMHTARAEFYKELRKEFEAELVPSAA